MDATISAENQAIVNTWTQILSKRGVEHHEEALETLLQFCKSHGVEINTDAAFSVKTREQIGQLILALPLEATKLL